MDTLLSSRRKMHLQQFEKVTGVIKDVQFSKL